MLLLVKAELYTRELDCHVVVLVTILFPQFYSFALFVCIAILLMANETIASELYLWLPFFFPP